MMRLRSPRLALAALAIPAVLGALWASGIQLALNTSASMPRGVYLTYPGTTIKRGDIVALCIPEGAHASLYRARHYLPDSPRCPSGLAPVLKPVAAIGGDLVSVEQGDVRINGVAAARAAVLATDSQGAAIPHLPDGWRTQLGPDEVFVLATYAARSLDSRYYGAVPTSQVLASAYPLLNF